MPSKWAPPSSRYVKVTDSRQEGKTGEIVLQAADPDCDDPQDACDDPEAVRQMVVYFYKNKYEDGKMLMMNAKAFALAVKYQIPGLRKLAEFKFQKALTYKADDELLRVAHYIYHSTTDDVTELRDQIVSELLARSERVRKTPEGQLGLRSIPGIAFDLLELTTKRQMDKEILCLRGHHFPESVIEVQCPFCNCRRPACWYCYETWKAQYCKA